MHVVYIHTTEDTDNLEVAESIVDGQGTRNRTKTWGSLIKIG